MLLLFNDFHRESNKSRKFKYKIMNNNLNKNYVCPVIFNKNIVGWFLQYINFC